MTYQRFERLVLIVGGAAILGAMTWSIGRMPFVEEIVGQVLLLVVLVGAVHWGRKGGFAAAAAASLVYFIVRIPTVVAEGGLTSDVIALLAVRILTYGIIGIIGGELFGRIKYVFAGLEDSSTIDEWTRVYNQRTIAHAMALAHGQQLRYGAPYSVVLVALAPQLTSELRPNRQRSLLRRVASHIRTDVRLIDEVGRLDDGRFLLVLPQTPKPGAFVASERLRAGVRSLLSARDEAVSSVVLGAPEDNDALSALLAEIAPPKEGPETGQPRASASVA